jgi:hypothetical protein
MNLTTEQLLLAAWKSLAPGADTSRGFPRGFWPDVARVALEMQRQQTITPTLDFQPTTCGRGDWPEETRLVTERPARSKSTVSAATRAANTARLLAALQGSLKP